MKLSSITVITFLLLTVTGITWAQNEEGRHLLHELSGPFIVYRTNIKEELKLSDSQKQKLLANLPEYLKNTKEAFGKFQNLQGGEREKEMQSYRQKNWDTFWPFLKTTLKANQFKRFQQLELQHEGPEALLGRPEIAKKLKITNKQRDQFIGVIQDMQRKIEPMIMEAQSNGNPQDILPKVIKIRKGYDVKIEAVMSAAQKKQWNEMRGKLFDVFIDN